MDLSCKTTRLLFEAAELAGIPRERLTAPLGLDAAYLTDVRNSVGWSTFVALAERLSEQVGHDPERLRAIGESMVHAPTWSAVRNIARGVVSAQALYSACHRWIAPTMFPHLPLSLEIEGKERVRFHAVIPDAYAGSAPFLHVFEGNLRAMPRVIGLPAATIESSAVTPRSIDVTLRVPRASSPFHRAVRAMRAAVGADDVIGTLEAQRGELARGFDALQRSSAELHGLLEALPDLVVIHRDGKILWVNRITRTTLGYDHAEGLVGSTLFELIDETSRDVMVERMRVRAGATGIPERTEVRLRRRDGELVTVEVAPTQSVTFGGAPARLLVGRDVTERLRLQQRLVTADRLASIGMVAAGVAHEINNPLAYVLGNIEIVIRDLLPLGGRVEEALQSLDVAVEGVARIRAIVRDLLLLARAEEHPAGPVDVRAILDSALALAGSTIAGRARVVRDDAPVPLVEADAARLGQVFLNLIANALESMSDERPDGHELRIRAAPGAGNRVVVQISDTGTGIAPDLVARIFDPFFTTKAIGRGTGLGLAICERIVAELGGEIQVESTMGLGSTFRVSLPAATPAATWGSSVPRHGASANDAAPPASPTRPARILVVDDKLRLLDTVRAALRDHHVVTATSARAALALIAASAPFDLVLCDVMMPDGGGRELHAALHGAHPGLAERVVFMTGGVSNDRTRELLGTTPNACLEKPFSADALRALVAARLAQRSGAGSPG